MMDVRLYFWTFENFVYIDDKDSLHEHSIYRMRDSKMGLLAQTTTILPLLCHAKHSR